MVPVPESNKMEGVETAADEAKPAVGQPDQASNQVEAEPRKKAEFYNVFWSLQTYFANPRTFTNKDALPEFKTAAEKVLAGLSEVTKKEQAMMGSVKGSLAGTKRKLADAQDLSGSERASGHDYVFAKFLTSPDLLEFEVSVARITCTSRLSDTLLLRCETTARRRHVPASNPDPTRHPHPPPHHFHFQTQGHMGRVPKREPSNGLYARRRRRQVGA